MKHAIKIPKSLYDVFKLKVGSTTFCTQDAEFIFEPVADYMQWDYEQRTIEHLLKKYRAINPSLENRQCMVITELKGLTPPEPFEGEWLVISNARNRIEYGEHLLRNRIDLTHYLYAGQLPQEFRGPLGTVSFAHKQGQYVLGRRPNKIIWLGEHPDQEWLRELKAC